MPHVVVIGAGISGLTAAYRLTKRMPNAKITLLERNSRIGGNIVTDLLAHADGEFLVEGAADSFLSRKPRGIALCEELGLQDRLQGRDSRFEKTYVRFAGNLHPLPSGLTGMIPTNLQAMNHSTLLSEQGRARLAEEMTIPSLPGDDDESLASFVTRRLGKEAYERMVEPLMSGIYAGDGTKLSLAATFPQLRQLEKNYGSLIKGLTATIISTGNAAKSPPAKYPPFVSLRGGIGQLLQQLADQIGTERIHLGAAVQSLQSSKSGKGYQISLGDGNSLAADSVILALPAYALAKLVEKIDPRLASLHDKIAYSSAATITLGYRDDKIIKKFNGYGYVIPQIEQSDVLACSWMSNKWEGRAPSGYHLVRVYIGRFGRAIAEAASDEELLAMALDEMHMTLGITGPPEFSRIFRWPQSMPQYTLGHVQRVAEIEAQVAQIAGLEIAGAAYHGVGIPDCIAAGEEAAERIAQSLKLAA